MSTACYSMAVLSLPIQQILGKNEVACGRRKVINTFQKDLNFLRTKNKLQRDKNPSFWCLKTKGKRLRVNRDRMLLSQGRLRR